MNKADMTIIKIKACEGFNDAVKKILNPIDGFGYKLTKNEQDFCLHYAKLYFTKQ